MARSAFQIRLLGLEELQQLERTLAGGSRRFVDRLASEIAHEIGDAAPGGAGHRLADSWKGRAISPNLGYVESDHPGAKARDRGAYLQGKHGQAIRFKTSEGLVFARFVRQKGTHYVERTLSKRRAIAELVFEQEFSNLKTRSLG